MDKNFLLLENFHSNMSPDLGFFFSGLMPLCVHGLNAQSKNLLTI
mgnify:FL=1